MKRKMDKKEKTRRQAWRSEAHKAPSVAPARQKQVAKSARAEAKEKRLLEIISDPTIVTLIDLRQRLADLFKGTTYKGPYVRVTHKEAFEARKLKRAAKALTDIAMENHEARVDALTTKIDAAELER